MSGVWSFLRDGKPTGARFIGPQKALAANTPDGCEAVAGIVEIERRNDPALDRERIIASIQDLEQKQLRSITELMDDPSNAEARRHYELRKGQIDQLRRKLTAETDTSER